MSFIKVTTPYGKMEAINPFSIRRIEPTVVNQLILHFVIASETMTIVGSLDNALEIIGKAMGENSGVFEIK